MNDDLEKPPWEFLWSVEAKRGCRLSPLPKRCLVIWAVVSLAGSAPAVELAWDADPSSSDAQAGNATWNLSNALWWDGLNTIPWPGAGTSIARFGFAGSVATVSGPVRAAGLVFGQRQEVRIPQSTSAGSNALLTVSGDIGAGLLTFSGRIFQGGYDPRFLDSGLCFTGGGVIDVAADFGLVNSVSSPNLQVHGPGTTLRYRGTWKGDEGGAFTSLAIRNGGHVVITGEAHLDFVQDAGGYTRQLWVWGDGSGDLELERGFVAERSLDGTVPDGLGSIRLSNATLITHHSQNLPLTIRRAANGDTQPNGHLVFENEAGAVWRAMDQPQTFPGAVWYFVSAVLDARVDVTHTGTTSSLISTDGYNYTAANAFQTNTPNVTITKTGPGCLTLAGEIAFQEGGTLAVTEGGVDLRSDPAAGGTRPNGVIVGPNLLLTIAETSWVRFGAPVSRLLSIANHGRLILEGGLVEALAPGTGFAQTASGRLTAALGPHPNGGSNSRLAVSGDATLSGVLEITRLPGYQPTAPTSWTILEATGGLDVSQLVLDDRSGLGLSLSATGNALTVTSSIAAPTVWFGYDVWVGDHFAPSEWDAPQTSGPLAVSPTSGWTNLLAYALEQAPDAVNRDVLPRLEWSDGPPALRCYVNPRKADLAYLVESSVALLEWEVVYDSRVDEPAGATEGTRLIAIEDPPGNPTPLQRFLRQRIVHTDL